MPKLFLTALPLFLLPACRTNGNPPPLNASVDKQEAPSSQFEEQDVATEEGSKSPAGEVKTSVEEIKPSAPVDLIAATKPEDAASKSKAEGSGVNNGTGPLGDLHSCKESGNDRWTFIVRSTAAIGLYQGILDQGDGTQTTLYCLRNEGDSEDKGSLNCRTVRDDSPASFVINEKTLTAELSFGEIHKTFTCLEKAP